MGSSAASGLLARCFVHPMDTVRTRIMASNTSSRLSVIGTLRDVTARDGFRGLYRGFGVTAAMQAPAVATFLTTYDVSKAKLASMTGLSTSSPLIHLTSGLVAEAVSAIFWVPMEVLKQRAQLRDIHASSLTAFRDLLRYEGIRSLFKGYVLTVGVFGPYSMLYFLSYEQWKRASCRLLHKQTPRDLPTPAILISAAASGGFAAALTTPLDIVKTRLQTQDDINTPKVFSPTSQRKQKQPKKNPPHHPIT